MKPTKISNESLDNENCPRYQCANRCCFQGRLSREILNRAIDQDLSLIISEDIISELSNKLSGKFHWKKEDVEIYVDTIREAANTITPPTKLFVITTDPDDNKILEAAVEGHADLIVSIDQDLLKLKTYQGIAIVHPKTLTWILPKLFEKNS